MFTYRYVIYDKTEISDMHLFTDVYLFFLIFQIFNKTFYEIYEVQNTL